MSHLLSSAGSTWYRRAVRTTALKVALLLVVLLGVASQLVLELRSVPGAVLWVAGVFAVVAASGVVWLLGDVADRLRLRFARRAAR